MSADDIFDNKALRDRLGDARVSASYKVTAYTCGRLPQTFHNMILSKWMRSLRFGNDLYKMIDSKSYYEAYNRYILALLGRAGTVVRTAALSDDPDVVLGFSVSHDNGKILDYVYVNPENRKMGIGAFLVPDSIEEFTHVTRTGLTIWNNKRARWKFNPFA